MSHPQITHQVWLSLLLPQIHPREGHAELHFFEPQHWIQVSGQLHTVAALPPQQLMGKLSGPHSWFEHGGGILLLPEVECHIQFPKYAMALLKHLVNLPTYKYP